MHTEYITFFDNEGFPNSGQLSRHCSRHNSISRKIGSSQLRKLGCHRFDLCRITFHESILIIFHTCLSYPAYITRNHLCKYLYAYYYRYKKDQWKQEIERVLQFVSYN